VNENPGPRLLRLAAGHGSADVGAKAAGLGAALAAGLPVLPGWVLPVAVGRPALAAGMAAVRGTGIAAGRRAVLTCPIAAGLDGELRAAVAGLGGRVIVRSSSPLESDLAWSGAFSSISEVGPKDVVTAVRSCWASAFAVDPLARLESCGLPLEALALAVLLQPEVRPATGGLARVVPAQPGSPGMEVIVDAVPGHPGALLAGWADGESARFRVAAPGSWPDLRYGGRPDGSLGRDLLAAAAVLAQRVFQTLGDNTIEWATAGDDIWLLQSGRSVLVPGERGARPLESTPAGESTAPPATPAATAALMTREWMPLLAATVLGQGEHLPGRPAAPGTAAGRLVACQPHERPGGDCRDAILLVDRPLPALAPLLFAARGVIARAGAAGSHLAEVARSLGVPMVIGCRPELVTGAPTGARGDWLAAIDGTTGDAAVLAAGPDHRCTTLINRTGGAHGAMGNHRPRQDRGLRDRPGDQRQPAGSSPVRGQPGPGARGQLRQTP
jgi:pyruvate,water dikinase